MKKILITGANSFIGLSVEKWLSQWPDLYNVETVDMIGNAWTEKDFSKYDVVFHVAGIAHSDIRKPDQQTIDLYYKINCDLAIKAAQKAKSEGVFHFIFMSSIIVFGNSAPLNKVRIISRDTEPHPDNFYGDSKLKAEQGLIKLADENYQVSIIRPPMIYGTGSRGNYPTLVRFATRMPVFPEIANQRSMLFVDNLAEFVRLLINNGIGGYFHPQNDEYVQTSEMVRLIAQIHHKKIIMTKIFNPLLRLFGRNWAIISKAFGNLVYDRELSRFIEPYCRFNLQESLERTES